MKNQITEMKGKLISIGTAKRNMDCFILAIRKFMEMEELTPTLLRELIDRIEVSHIEGVGKNKVQRFTIKYKFIGIIEIPEAPKKRRNISLNTRQGVAVEYRNAI